MNSSCSIEIKGFFSGYKKLNKEQPTLLKKATDKGAICNAEYSDSCKVLILNAEELGVCLTAEDKVVLYSWSPHCSGSYCYGLDRVQAYCNEKGMKLYVVADYYDLGAMDAYYELEFPIIGIDMKAYKNKLVPVYTKKFLEDLSIVREKDDYNRLLYLENGKFIQSFLVLEDIQ